MSDFVSHGEFAIYAASLVSPASYLILRDYKRTIFFPGRILLGLCALVLLVFSVMIFSAGSFWCYQDF